MIHLIVAVAENNAIGKDNDLLWYIPQDLKRFKLKTMNHPIIMGRKTFESFGGKPLPKRHHIVISSQENDNSEQITWVKTVQEAIEQAKVLDNEIYVIGGGTIYRQTIDLAEVLDITRVHATFDADTFFPEIPEKFKCIEDEKHWDESSNLDYSFRTYVLKKGIQL